ncbi:MAG: hypothetical protein JSS76_00535 [Bacteroidetes bacterium]|nr:hypothetical protein [Bacteroidota bacterium]
MSIIDRKTFTLSKGPNGSGTFYSFLNTGFDEIAFEYIRATGNVKDLYVMTFEKWYAHFENPKFYTLQQFIEAFAHKGERILMRPEWHVDLALGVLNKQGKFVGLSDNVHLNFPGMSGNAPHKIDYPSIPDFNILFAYQTHSVEFVM